MRDIHRILCRTHGSRECKGTSRQNRQLYDPPTNNKKTRMRRKRNMKASIHSFNTQLPETTDRYLIKGDTSCEGVRGGTTADRCLPKRSHLARKEDQELKVRQSFQKRRLLVGLAILADRSWLGHWVEETSLEIRQSHPPPTVRHREPYAVTQTATSPLSTNAHFTG